MSVVDEKVAQKLVAAVEDDPRRAALAAFPGTERVFDANLREVREDSSGCRRLFVAEWSGDYPVVWALGPSCVFRVKGRGILFSNFDFSSFALTAGERFRVHGHLGEDDRTTFRSLVTEAFECAVVRSRGSATFGVSLGPPFARRPLSNPFGLGTPARVPGSVDASTADVFLVDLFSLYAEKDDDDEGWADERIPFRWDSSVGPLLCLALGLDEEELRSAARKHGGEVKRFVDIALRAPWIRTKNECDATNGRCVPRGLAVTDEDIEDNSKNGWKTKIGLRAFATWDTVRAGDCTWECRIEQIKKLKRLCGENHERFYFHEIRACDCRREFKMCGCDSVEVGGEDDDASYAKLVDSGRYVHGPKYCFRCNGYTRAAQEKIPDICRECVAARDGGTPVVRMPRAIMQSVCRKKDCVIFKRQALPCACGIGASLAKRQISLTREFVDETREQNSKAGAEFRVVVCLVEGGDGGSRRLARAGRAVTLAVRERANDYAVALKIRKVTLRDPEQARSCREIRKADFVVTVGPEATIPEGRAHAHAGEGASDPDAARETCASVVADLEKALRELRCDQRVSRVATTDALALEASRPYEEIAMNARWRVQSFTWRSLRGTYVDGRPHRRCLQRDCSLRGKLPVGVIGSNDVCVACGTKSGKKYREHETCVEDSAALGVGDKRETLRTLKLLLSEYY